MTRYTVDASDMAVALPEGKIVRQTAKAVLYEFDGETKWIPQSVIHDDSDIWKDGEEGVLKVQSWWAEKEGLA